MRRFHFLVFFLPFFLTAEERVVDLQDLGKIVYCVEEGLCQKDLIGDIPFVIQKLEFFKDGASILN